MAFPGLQRHSIDKLCYVCGSLAVDSRLYVAAYAYNFADQGKEVFHIIDQRDVSLHRAVDGFSSTPCRSMAAWRQ